MPIFSTSATPFIWKGSKNFMSLKCMELKGDNFEKDFFSKKMCLIQKVTDLLPPSPLCNPVVYILIKKMILNNFLGEDSLPEKSEYLSNSH